MSDQDINALLTKASAQRRAGQVEEAIASYEQLLALRSDLPDSWYNLGWLQRQARRFEAALHSYGQALDRGVSQPEEVHLNRAVILSDHLARPAEAEQELLKALSLNRSYVPALLNLGNLQEDLGRQAEARASYERALDLEPQNMLALARRAGVAGTVTAGDPLIARLRQALGRPDLAAADRADLGFAFGRLLDSAGEYDAAFAAYEAANQAGRDLLSQTGHPGYQPAQHEDLVDRLIQTFAEPVHPIDATGAAPLFICGMFRSGSTLIEQILASHSSCRAGGELDLIPSLVRSLPQPYPDALAGLSQEAMAELRETYLKGLGAPLDADSILTDKRPDNFLHIGLIKSIFPNARIVHTRRNPLDNILSIYFLHLNPEMAYGLDLRDAVHWYGQYQRLMAHWKKLYPNDIFDLDYDLLVRRPRETIDALLAFLGLEWEEACLSFHATSTPVKTASVWQVRKPLYQASSGRWRNYAAQLAPVRRLLGDDT